MRDAARIASQIVQWFTAHQRDLPWRRTRDPYAIWISEIMLQQTQVKTVIPYWERWMRELATIEALAEAKPERVLKLWEGLGYYSRARNLQKAALQIVAEHQGNFPRGFDDILELPGIGRYTAGAIASIAFGEPAPIVDGNVIRVLCRYFAIRGDPKGKAINAQLWQIAEKLVRSAHASGACSELNQGLMELGATVCLPNQPRCGGCPLRNKCLARMNNLIQVLPETAKRPEASQRLFRALVVRHRDKILMRQRPLKIVNGGFWELPNWEVGSEKAHLPAVVKKEALLCVLKHTITRYKMTLEVYSSRSKASFSGAQLISTEQLAQIPIVNAHRRALAKLGLLPSPKAPKGPLLMAMPQS